MLSKIANNRGKVRDFRILVYFLWPWIWKFSDKKTPNNEDHLFTSYSAHLQNVQTLHFIVMSFISVQSLMLTEFEMGFHICAYVWFVKNFFYYIVALVFKVFIRDRPFKCVMVLKGYHDFVTTVRAPFSR